LKTADSWKEPAREPARVISSAVLFNGAGEIIIEHAGGQYRLKITRQNKLILNK
jgi:hemin uptake protein HemP